MGVRGLKSYVENHCPSAFYPVQITSLADDFRRQHPGEKPTVAVYGKALQYHLYLGLDWVCSISMPFVISNYNMFIDS